MRKFLFGLAPLLALVAFALAPSAALAQKHKSDGPCRVLVAWTALPAANACAEPPGVSAAEAQNLREEEDGAGTTPISTNFVTSGMLVNTKTKIRFGSTIAGVKIFNEVPIGYAFFGIDVLSNPTNSTTVCRDAAGTMPWVDIQDGKPSAAFNVSTAASFYVISDSSACSEATRGVVCVREVTLLFEQLGAGKTPVIGSGTFCGKFSQPNAEKCPAGGIELNNVQGGVTTEPASTAVVVDNGEEGKPALLCFVSANNYLFPKEAPKWGTSFTNATEKAGIGIWKTKEP